MYKITDIRSLNFKEQKPLSTIIFNFLRYFKVHLFLFFIPLCAYFYALGKTPKVQAFYGKLQMVIMNRIMSAEASLDTWSILKEQFKLLLHDRYVLAIAIITFFFLAILNSFCIVGAKHTFYPKIDLFSVIGEGFKKIWRAGFLFLLGTCVGLITRHYLGNFLSSSHFTVLQLWAILIVTYVFIIAPLTFFVPLFVFSGNGFFGSIIKSVRIYYKNFFKMLIINVVIILILATIYFIYVFGWLLLIKWTHAHYQEIVQWFFRHMNHWKAIAMTVIGIITTLCCLSSYVGLFATQTTQMLIFILYPELLEDDDAESAESYNPLPDSYFNDIKGGGTLPTQQTGARQNISFNNDIPTIPVKNNEEKGDSLSVPNTHKNDRPFLSEKLSETVFERFVSKNSENSDSSADIRKVDSQDDSDKNKEMYS